MATATPTLVHSLLHQHQFLASHLLHNQFLLPSLLLSLKFPQNDNSTAAAWDGAPDEWEDEWTQSSWQNKRFKREELKASVVANQLALAHLSQVVLGLLTQRDLRNLPPPAPSGPPSLGDVADLLKLLRKEPADTASPNLATPGQFPWQVSVQVTNWVDFSLHLCGGVLLTPGWVLTVAHCVASERVSDLSVVAGRQDLLAWEAGQKMAVTEIIQHPQYIYWERPYLNDVALLRLREPLTLSPDLQPANTSLTVRRHHPAVGKCRESGWGAQELGQEGTRHLLFADVTLHAPQHCHHSYPTHSFCAGDQGIGSCSGDNGGLVVCVDQRRQVQLGIMSWREECGHADKPAIYMDLSNYWQWINKVMSVPEAA